MTFGESFRFWIAHHLATAAWNLIGVVACIVVATCFVGWVEIRNNRSKP